MARAFCRPDLQIGADPLKLHPAGERAVADRRVQRVADREQPGGRRADPLGQRRDDAALDEQPGARDADLAAIGEDGPCDGLCEPVQIDRVGEDDLRGFAAAFQHHRLAVRLSGRDHDPPPGLRRSDEADLVDILMAGKRRACFARPRHRVDHARRQARFHRDPRQREHR